MSRQLGFRHIVTAAGLVAGLLLAGTLAAADDSRQTEQKIERLKADIRKLENSLRSAKDERHQLNSALRQAEKAGAQLSRQVRATQSQVKAEQQQIKQLQGQRQVLQRKRKTQQQGLAEEINAAYRTGREDRLRLLLNQQQPERIARMLRYHQYFSDVRSQKLADLEQTLAQLDRVETELNASQRRLKQEQRQLEQRSKELQASRQQRQQALTSIQQKIRSQSRSLSQLQADQQRLEQVLKELQQSLALNELKVSTQAFAKLKGKLPWPTPRNRVLRSFGSKNSQGVRRDGMVLQARMGDPVKAVHHGRVVFSDWLRGYGLLLIIDHGDGYMSLYGHNQSLAKAVGDWIAVGDAVARAGDSGGQRQSGLYFAIRYKGKPINPKPWLKRG